MKAVNPIVRDPNLYLSTILLNITVKNRPPIKLSPKKKAKASIFNYLSINDIIIPVTAENAIKIEVVEVADLGCNPRFN